MTAIFKIFRNFIWLITSLAVFHVFAYVPAQPTNSSQVAIDGGLNITDISKLHLRWFSNGSYSQNISYQLAGKDSQGISKGALVHFSESTVNASTPPTTTPWIAMISCDFNATIASQGEDVFTLARDKGAVAALLYSLYSLACVINPEYADPENFDQVFDIFSTQSLTSAHLIDYQFGQIGPVNETLYGVYNSLRLNESASIINSTIQQGSPTAPGYLFAILQAYNATGDIGDPANTGAGTASTAPPPNSSSPNTALAMIILYAITGCVSALFCVVIVSGAIRAIRHPERYGPRARNGINGPGQSRARGLTRAILDTFPVVKFGGSTPTQTTTDTSTQHKDVESQSEGRHSGGSAVGLREWEVIDQDNNDVPPRTPVVTAARETGDNESAQELPVVAVEKKDDPDSPRRRPRIVTNQNFQSKDRGEGTSQNPPRTRDEVVPDAIGRETCPICIMDFEEGDDLRLLPCEGKHRFHQTCVDPWLLELSSACPICRQDFLALENILSGESELGHEGYNAEIDHRRSGRASSPTSNRFSRYLRFANRRHHRGQGEDEADPTDPYMPQAPDSPAHPARPSPS